MNHAGYNHKYPPRSVCNHPDNAPHLHRSSITPRTSPPPPLADHTNKKLLLGRPGRDSHHKTRISAAFKGSNAVSAAASLSGSQRSQMERLRAELGQSSIHEAERTQSMKMHEFRSRSKHPLDVTNRPRRACETASSRISSCLTSSP